jgi:hypothetical protein
MTIDGPGGVGTPPGLAKTWIRGLDMQKPKGAPNNTLGAAVPGSVPSWHLRIQQTDPAVRTDAASAGEVPGSARLVRGAATGRFA